MSQLFLSCVSDEFRRYRDTLRHNLNLPDCTIQIQEDFCPGGGPPSTSWTSTSAIAMR